MGRLKFVIGLVLGGLLMLFWLQNMAKVELTFLLWTFESRRVLVVGASLAVGVVIGWLLGLSRERIDEETHLPGRD